MALIQCPDCGNMISENADSCPKCGYSLKAKRELLEKNRIEELKRKKNKIHVLEFFIFLCYNSKSMESRTYKEELF